MKKWVHFPNVTNTNCLSGPKLCFKWQTFKWSQQQQQQHFNEILRKSFCNTLLDKLACFQSAELSNEPLLVCVCVCVTHLLRKTLSASSVLDTMFQNTSPIRNATFFFCYWVLNLELWSLEVGLLWPQWCLASARSCHFSVQNFKSY